MKLNVIVLVVLILITSKMLSQNRKPWTLEVGVNAIDVYPVGELTPQGPYFDEFFNVTDHWNFGAYFKVSKQLTNNFDLGVMLSSNSISKWGQIGNIDVSLNVDDQQYLGIDLMSNYFLMSVNSIKPIICNGFVYTWMQEGTYNTIVTKGGTDNLVGAMTVNIGAGLKFDVNDFFFN